MKKLLCALLALALALLCACSGKTAKEPVVAYEEPAQTSEPEASPEPEPVQTPEPEPEPEPDVIVTSRLAVAGDIVAHMPLNQDAYDAETGKYDYSHIYQDAAEIFAQADYCVADMETTFSGDGSYSGYPCFDSPDDMAYGLRDVGIDLLNTANNHSMDTGFSGLCRTLDVLDEAGIAHIGTYRTQAERDESSGVVVADVGGVSVAFISYTYGTNGIPLAAGNEFSVNLFNVDYMTDLSVPDTEKIDADMAYARSLGTDFIAVIMHWGNEYATEPSAYQQEMADYMFLKGADLVLGGHVHVPQPMETREITLPDGTTKTGYLCYCLGNFTSNQQDRYTNLTAIVNIDFEKNMTTGEAVLKNVGYVPMFMLHRDTASERHLLLNIYDAMADYESGNTEIVDAALYDRLQTGLADIHSIMGETLDAMYAPAA